MDREQTPDHVEVTPCYVCDNFPGCRHLRTKKGQFLLNNVITKNDNPAVCVDFVEAGESEMRVREAFVESTSESLVSLRALYYRGSPPIEDPKEFEEEEEVEDVPNFAAWLYDEQGNIRGLTTDQREEQLRYQTDDDGNLLEDDDGSQIPRGSFPIRKYVEDTEGPVCPRVAEANSCSLELVSKIVKFWKTNELIPAILRSEYDSGLLIRPGKGRKSTPEKAKTSNNQNKEDKSKMADRKKILIGRSNKKTGGKSSGDSKTTTTTGPKPKKGPVSSKKPAGPKAPKKAKTGNEEGNAGEPTSTVDLSEVLAKLDKVLERQDQLETNLAEVCETLDGQVQTCVTLLHDATMQKLNELGGALGSAFQEINEDAAQPIWEVLSQIIDGEELKYDAQNLMSGSEGEQHSILLYLDQVENGGEAGNEGGGDGE